MVHRGDPRDLEATAQRALKGAAWRVDPKEIPPSFKRTWQAVEFGNYGLASRGIYKGLKSRDADIKGIAVKLEKAVMKEFKEEANVAASLAREKDFWNAYKQANRVQNRFGDFELPNRFKSMTVQLKKNSIVQRERKALKQFRLARDLVFSARSKSKAALGRRKLKEVSEEFPQTEAADLATKLLSN